jgi:aspartyl-tRNA synthetase
MKIRYARELAVINEQYPFEEFKCADPVVKINFREGVKLINEAGFTQSEFEDLTTETEKVLGKIVREKYDTDFYMLYGYPINARPFYTMLDPNDERFTNSYDFFMRGEEITSGAQRIHCPIFLA